MSLPVDRTCYIDSLEADRRNNIDICMRQFLDAASHIHTVMCRLDYDHGCQSALNEALHAVLIGAQQCRQAVMSSPVRLAAKAMRDDDDE